MNGTIYCYNMLSEGCIENIPYYSGSFVGLVILFCAIGFFVFGYIVGKDKK